VIVNPGSIVPAEVELEDWLFDPTAGPERRMAEARFVHGHLLKPGDVARTEWRLRCAQPPYDSLPIPRADIPAGIILSREADAWIREERVEDVALPLYEGRMIGQFDFSQKGWVSGKGRSAVWRDIPWERKVIEPQYLMGAQTYRDSIDEPDEHWTRAAFMDVTSATNTRTVIASAIPPLPCGNKVPVLESRSPLLLSALLSTFAFDFVARRRMTGLSLNYFILAELALPSTPSAVARLAALAANLQAAAVLFAPEWISATSSTAPSAAWALSPAARLTASAQIDALSLAAFRLEPDEARFLLLGEGATARPDPKGFWRVDKDKNPELRQTMLALAAFDDLMEKMRTSGGDRDAGIDAFLTQNRGEGWMLPETLRLADYGFAHDGRTEQPQPVASRLGPRLFDWQLAQNAEESWRECRLHARNLLGQQGYDGLLRPVGGADAQRIDAGQTTTLGEAPDALF
jgi:hypothetical protein